MKYLICGNAPCLVEELKGKDLSDYKVIRINDWKHIEGYDNKCDIWVCYPLHQLGEIEGCYDFKPYIEANYPEIWVTHPWLMDKGLEILKRNFVLLSSIPFLCIQADFKPNAPTTGTLAIFMALILNNFKADIYIAGFDFYQNEKSHYFDNTLNKDVSHYPHDPLKDKKWVENLIIEGFIKRFSEVGL